MSLAVLATLEPKDGARQMARFPPAIRKAQDKWVGAAVARTERFVKRALLNPALGPGKAGAKWYRSTGGYRRSIRSVVTRSTGSSSASGVVGTNFVGAGVHEFGQPREIRPVKRKWLTIPTAAAQTGTRIPRAPDFGAALMFLPTRRNDLARLVLRGDVEAKNPRPTVVFWLVKKVTTKQRAMWGPARDATQRWIERRVPEALLDVVQTELRAASPLARGSSR